MYPTLLSIGIFEFHTYTVAAAVAFLTSVLLAVRENYKLENPYPVTPIGGLWAFFGGLVGAKAYYILQYDEIRHLYRAFYIWSGGLVFYGGLIGGFLGAVVYIKWKRLPILPSGDIVMPYVPLGQALARPGCFFNGCCWGSQTDMPWGVCYPKGSLGAYHQHLEQNLIDSSAPCSLPVHPVQLYAAAGLLLVFFVMRYAYKRPHHTGAVMLLYPLLYGTLRFFTECFRGDSARHLFHMTASQMIALAAALLAGAAFMFLRATVWRTPPAVGEP